MAAGNFKEKENDCQFTMSGWFGGNKKNQKTPPRRAPPPPPPMAQASTLVPVFLRINQ